MIGGLLLDVVVLGAVALFGWAGAQLGGLASIVRLVASLFASLVAVMLRDPVGNIVESALGASEDFCRLIGMLITGAISYIAVANIARWWIARRQAQRVDAGYDDDAAPDSWAMPRVGMVAGGLLGLGWAIAFVAMLVLLPTDNFLSRGAVRSVPGIALIEQEGVLRWAVDGFPHYAQTLPKGRLGSVIGEAEDLPMRGEDSPDVRAQDAPVLLDEINRLRTRRNIGPLSFNSAISAVAERHARDLALERRLSESTVSGGSLAPRVLSALGESAPSFRDEVGIVVAWAHTPGNAIVGIADDAEMNKRLADPAWTEVGIGVVDAGWFNGRIYVLLFIEVADEEAASGTDATGQEPDAAASGGELGADAEAPLEDDTAADESCDEPLDLDGDGVADEESVDPACR
ncbi:MAG: hypothetical protein JWM90_425 [Thermoleophilia bacterium]|nr:hypothetical protein [Thermoleophilia bacterium]